MVSSCFIVLFAHRLIESINETKLVKAWLVCYAINLTDL